MQTIRWVYKDKLWPSLRRQVFVRDLNLCQICCKRVLHGVGRNHPRKSIVDHIEPLSKAIDKALVLANLQTLHKRCHDQAKQRQDKNKRLIRHDLAKTSSGRLCGKPLSPLFRT